MFEKVKKLISRQLSCDEAKITPESNLLTDLGADSMELVEMVMTLETELKIEIPDEDLQNLKTVGDLVALLEKKTK